ncbi:MAG: hypothetical protein DMG10_08015 [Acidobacteria bacterium]|nr:MAG: hypothetical protein DMG10_08015 [Acidobacteriota bacterium]
MLFSASQRNLVAQALHDAEERTTNYYCIPPFRWQKLQFDLLTRGDPGWRPVPEGTLAEILCFHRKGWTQGAVRERQHQFFRIQLNDESILQAANRENLQADLYPFLVYILTHEMVHLVRLSTILDREISEKTHRESEESRVQKISRQILSGPGHRIFAPVLERFCVPSFSGG